MQQATAEGSSADGPPLRHGRRATALAVALALSVAGLVATPTAPVQAEPEPSLGGPVILDGTDAASHGNAGGKGDQATHEDLDREWVYVARAWELISDAVDSNGHANNDKVAVIGTDETGTAGDGGCYGMVVAISAATGIDYETFNGAAGVEELFDRIGDGDPSTTPRMIHIVEDDDESFHCDDSMDRATQEALNDHATELARFVNDGGGLHAQAHDFDWLSTLMPDAQYHRQSGGASTGTGLQLTEIAIADDEFFVVDEQELNDSLVSPWHGYFENFEPLRGLATGLDSHSDKMVIVGGDPILLPVGLSIDLSETSHPADGTSTVTVTAEVTDENSDAYQGNSLIGLEIFDGPNAGTTIDGGTVDQDGKVTFELSSHRNGIDRFTVQDENGEVESSAEVQWTVETGLACAGDTLVADGEGLTCTIDVTVDDDPYDLATAVTVRPDSDDANVAVPDTVTIPVGSSSGTFTVTAAAGAGSSPTVSIQDGNAQTPRAGEDEVTLTVLALPGKATGLEAGPADAGGVELIWDAPTGAGASEIDGYRIDASDDGGATWSTVVDDTGSDATSHRVTGLDTAGEYVFRVAPVVDGAVGEFSDATTEPVSPSSPPSGGSAPEPEPRRTSTGELARPVPGGGEVTVGGEDATSDTTVSTTRDRSVVSGDGFEIEVWNADGDEQETETGVGDVLRVPQGGNAGVRVAGFAPGSEVRVWVFSEPRLIGTFTTDAEGALEQGLAEIIAELTPCGHTLQAEGQLADGREVTAALGIWVTANPFPFGDVDVRGAHAPGIGCLQALDIVRGYSSDVYDEHGGISRAQSASVIAQTLGLEAATPPAFSDVAGAVHAEGIAALVEHGIMMGVGDERFDPGGTLTRGQTASILAAAAGMQAEGDAPFDDVAGNVHAPGIAALTEHGVISGFADGTFRPDDEVTRGQFASLTARLLPTLLARADDLGDA